MTTGCLVLSSWRYSARASSLLYTLDISNTLRTRGSRRTNVFVSIFSLLVLRCLIVTTDALDTPVVAIRTLLRCRDLFHSRTRFRPAVRLLERHCSSLIRAATRCAYVPFWHLTALFLYLGRVLRTWRSRQRRCHVGPRLLALLGRSSDRRIRVSDACPSSRSLARSLSFLRATLKCAANVRVRRACVPGLSSRSRPSLSIRSRSLFAWHHTAALIGAKLPFFTLEVRMDER